MKNKLYMFIFLLLIFPLFVNAQVFTEVSTIEELSTSITNGESVKLIDDIDLSETGLIIPTGVSVTIDLNGYEIAVISEYNLNIRVSVGATLTVMDSGEDGKIYSYGPMQNNGRGVIDVNGTFILESGTIEAVLDNQNTGGNVNAIVVSKENGATEYDESVTAKVIINGGTINSTSSAITNHNSFGGNTKIIINGGTINSVYYGIYSNYTAGTIPAEHDVEISGGVFNTGLASVYIASSDFAYKDESHSKSVVPDLTITGGTFNGTDAITFVLYNDTDVTEEKILKYFDVTISGAKFVSDPSEFKSYYASGWYLESETVNGYYSLKEISLSESLYEEPSSVTKPTVYIKNFDAVNSIIFSSIAIDAEIANLLSTTNSNPTVEILIDETDNISEDIITEMKKLIGDAEILTYFNISVLLTIDEVEKNLENLTEEIELSIKLPDDFINYDDSITRTYYVIREHDGVIEKLETTLDGNDLTFKTDKFSTYALAYEDITNPNTSDNIVTFIAIAGISLVAIITILKLKNSRNKKKT